MGTADWHDHGACSLGLLVGEWLILLHAGDAAPCTLPPGGPFVPTVDSTCADGSPVSTRPLPGDTTITLPTGSLLLLRRDVPPAR
jgi:glycogen operon protein